MKQTSMTQARQMRAKWPGVRLLRRTRKRICWEGELRPLRKTYTIALVLDLEHLEPVAAGPPNPLVMALKPLLRPRDESPREAIPHVYPNPAHPLLPLLCLFHPPTDRFDPRRHSVANTIVPWTLEWLACYEGWLATGTWYGGGVSHD